MTNWIDRIITISNSFYITVSGPPYETGRRNCTSQKPLIRGSRCDELEGIYQEISSLNASAPRRHDKDIKNGKGPDQSFILYPH